MNPITKLKQKVNEVFVCDDEVGEAKRTVNRDNKINAVIKKGLQIFIKHFPKSEFSPPIFDGFDKKWVLFFDDLTKVFTSENDIKNAHDAIAKALDKGTKDGLWNVSISTQISYVRRDKQFKSRQWFQNAQAIQNFEAEWLNKLSETLNLKELLSRCICSAMFHSGLNEEWHLKALFETLQQRRPLHRKDNLIWLDLYLKPEDFRSLKKQKLKTFPFSTNCEFEQSDCLVTRFFPTTLTLSFIYSFLYQLESDVRGIKSLNSYCIDEFWQHLIKDIKDKTDTQLTLKQICNASVSIAELKPNIECSESILQSMTKCNMSYSLPSKNWIEIGDNFDYLELDSILNFKGISVVPKPHYNKSNNCGGGKFGLIGDMRDALKIHKNGKKITNSKILASIYQFFSLDEHALQHERILVSWLISLLEKGLSPSTVSNYFSSIGVLWITEAQGVDADNPYEYFENLYTGMLETTISEKNKYYKKNRLINLHNFAVINFNFPKLVTFTSNRSDVVPHVRSSFISESVFKALLLSINNAKGAQLIEKQILSLIFIFAYRTALRLGEVLKLKIKDFEWSSMGWLFIRDNDIDSNKSNAGKRKIPLIDLLTPEECAYFKTFLRNINFNSIRLTNKNRVLFSLSENKQSPVEKFLVSNLASQVLSEISGLGLFVFHCLRHTALSRMQLLIHHEKLDIANVLGPIHKEIIPYSDEKISKIVNNIGGDNKLKMYWALACFAGHRNPQTTFNSYLHFTDLIIYCSLNRNKQKFDALHLASFSNLSKRSLIQLKRESLDGEIEISQIQPLLIKKIKNKPFCKSYKNKFSSMAKPLVLEVQKTQDSSIQFNQIYELLSALEKGESVEQLMWLYSITQDTLDLWVEKAKTINRISTSKSKSRNISSYRKNGLITPYPKAQADVNEIVFLRENLRSKLSKMTKLERGNALTTICKIVLSRSNASKSEMLFRHYSTLKVFLDFMSFFNKNRWYIKLNVADKTDLKKWREVTKGYNVIINKGFTQDKRNPNGQALVHLLSKNTPQKVQDEQWIKYSSNVVKFVTNIIAISALDIRTLRTF